MKVKSVMYAAVGAPVVAVRKAGDKVTEIKDNWDKTAGRYGKKAEAQIEAWATEGEKVVAKISDGKVVEEIQAKVDLDQAKVQVSKLRDQLEDMLATWKTSFRPEGKPEAKVEVKVEAPKAPAAKAPAAKKPAAKTTAAKTTAAKKPAAKTTAAKKPAAKSTAAKAPAAKS